MKKLIIAVLVFVALAWSQTASPTYSIKEQSVFGTFGLSGKPVSMSCVPEIAATMNSAGRRAACYILVEDAPVRGF